MFECEFIFVNKSNRAYQKIINKFYYIKMSTNYLFHIIKQRFRILRDPAKFTND